MNAVAPPMTGGSMVTPSFPRGSRRAGAPESASRFEASDADLIEFIRGPLQHEAAPCRTHVTAGCGKP